jgi:nuclear RNA export factor
VSLNLSNNRIQKLDDLSNLVGKVPNLKTLNLSNNEVGLNYTFDLGYCIQY